MPFTSQLRQSINEIGQKCQILTQNCKKFLIFHAFSVLFVCRFPIPGLLLIKNALPYSERAFCLFLLYRPQSGACQSPITPRKDNAEGYRQQKQTLNLQSLAVHLTGPLRFCNCPDWLSPGEFCSLERAGPAWQCLPSSDSFSSLGQNE